MMTVLPSNNALILTCLLFLLTISFNTSTSPHIIITQFPYNAHPHVKLFFRAISATNPQHFSSNHTTAQQKKNQANYYLHACVRHLPQKIHISPLEPFDSKSTNGSKLYTSLQYEYLHLGVRLHFLDAFPGNVDILEDTEEAERWYNLQCALQVGRDFTQRGVGVRAVSSLFFAARQLLVVGDLQRRFWSQLPTRNRQKMTAEHTDEDNGDDGEDAVGVYCTPKRMPGQSLSPSPASVSAGHSTSAAGLCELDVFSLSLAHVDELYLLFNASLVLHGRTGVEMSAAATLDHLLGRLGLRGGPAFFRPSRLRLALPAAAAGNIAAGTGTGKETEVQGEAVVDVGPVLYAGRPHAVSPASMYRSHARITDVIAMVEFDQQYHRIGIRNCQIEVMVDWPVEFNTLDTIQAVFDDLYGNPNVDMASLVGCAEDPADTNTTTALLLSVHDIVTHKIQRPPWTYQQSFLPFQYAVNVQHFFYFPTEAHIPRVVGQAAVRAHDHQPSADTASETLIEDAKQDKREEAQPAGSGRIFDILFYQHTAQDLQYLQLRLEHYFEHPQIKLIVIEITPSSSAPSSSSQQELEDLLQQAQLTCPQSAYSCPRSAHSTAKNTGDHHHHTQHAQDSNDSPDQTESLLPSLQELFQATLHLYRDQLIPVTVQPRDSADAVLSLQDCAKLDFTLLLHKLNLWQQIQDVLDYLSIQSEDWVLISQEMNVFLDLDVLATLQSLSSRRISSSFRLAIAEISQKSDGITSKRTEEDVLFVQYKYCQEVSRQLSFYYQLLDEYQLTDEVVVDVMQLLRANFAVRSAVVNYVLLFSSAHASIQQVQQETLQVTTIPRGGWKLNLLYKEGSNTPQKQPNNTTTRQSVYFALSPACKLSCANTNSTADSEDSEAEMVTIPQTVLATSASYAALYALIQQFPHLQSYFFRINPHTGKVRTPRIAVVSGHVGQAAPPDVSALHTATTPPPPEAAQYLTLPQCTLPSNFGDCYFVSNSYMHVSLASAEGWKGVYYQDIPLHSTNTEEAAAEGATRGRFTIELTDPVRRQKVSKHVTAAVFNAFHSKQLKVFPQYFVQVALYYYQQQQQQFNASNSVPFPGTDPTQVHNAAAAFLREEDFPYDFIIWVDDKFSLDYKAVLHALVHQWDMNDTAMQLHRRPLCCGADLEFVEALQLSRYALFFEEMGQYLLRQAAQGLQLTGERHFQSGFIAYNMRHPDTFVIQSQWYEDIQQVGLLCQMPLYFLAQRFVHQIKELRREWKWPKLQLVYY